jgi:hypothetical protein
MNLRLVGGEEAVGHVDRDALLALGGQAVDQQREVDLAALRADLLRVGSSAASWSSKSIFDSYSRRPISVLLPSSTLPQVMKRSRLLCSCCLRYALDVDRRSGRWERVPSEVPLLLLLLHRAACRGRSRGPGARSRGQQHLLDDLRQRVGVGLDRARSAGSSPGCGSARFFIIGTRPAAAACARRRP